jgi:hypothetical protein
MRIKTSTYILLFLNMTFAPLHIVANDPSKEETQAEQEVLDHLIRAETWYWMARVTFNSLEYHENAEKEYLTAKVKAALLPQSLKEKYTNTAEAGYEQTYWRKINAWNSFRNIFPAAWWYSQADLTLDYQDEDHLMLALSGCWAGLEAGLSKQLTPKIFVVPRCNDSEKFEQSTDCGEIKDEFLNIMDVNTRFLGIRDDAVATAIGPGWEEFVKGGKPKLEHIKALGEFHQVENIVVVDIYVVDEFEDPIVAGRIDIQFNQWDTNTMRLMSAGNESGVVVSLRDRRWMVPSWLIFLLIIAFIFSYIQLKINEDTQNNEPKIAFTKYLVPNFIFFLAGYLLSYFARIVSDQFIPDWGAMALNTDHYLPLAEMWLWTFVHGAVIMVGPIILCAYFLLQFGQRIPGIGEVLDKNDFQNTSTILFSVQAGALGALFSPIIIAWHNEGIILALSLSIAALILSISVARPFSSIVGADSEQYSGLTLFLGILGLILIIPIGFFRPEGAGYWPIAIAFAQAIIISLTIIKLNGKISKEQTEEKEKPFLEGGGAGSIDHPKWVDRENAIIKETEGIVKTLLDEATNGKVQTFIIGNQNGIGKTRLMQEIYQMLNTQKNDPPWKLVWSTADEADEDHVAEPYSLISKAFGDAIGISNLADKQSKQAKFREVLTGVEGTLSDLPMGIGAIFDFGDEDHEAASKEQIIRDMTEAVRKQIDDYPLAFFLDDIQWSDQDSLDLLEKMIKKLSQKQHQNSLVFVLGATKEESIEHYFTSSTLSATIIDLKLFNSDKIIELLKGTGLTNIPPWLGEKLVEHIGETDTTPEMIIEVIRALTIKGADGTNELPAELNHSELNNDNTALIDDKIKEAIPEELEDSIRMRLNELHEEDRIILEAAAEIGRSFSVTLLAAGLEQDRLTLLRSLKRIEDDFHLIIDIQTTDDIMSLESQTLRRVLKENSIYTNNSNKRELYKEMHFKIAQKMIENEDSFAPLEIMQHCILSGSRLTNKSIDYGIKAIVSAANKQSWPTVESIIKKIKDKDTAIIKYANKEQLDQIKIFEALALRGMGKESENVSKLLKELLQSDSLDKYQLFYTYIINEESQINYRNENKDELESQLANFHSLIDALIIQNNVKEDAIIEQLCEFYKIVSSQKSNKIDEPTFIYDLQSLCNKIKSLVVDKDQIKNQQRLLSMAYQQLGNFSSDDEEKIFALDESLRLKKELKDLEGLAFNYGGFSQYYFNKNDYDHAAEFRAKSLLIEEKRGNDPGQSFCLNTLAQILWKNAEENGLKQEEKDKIYESSLHYAHAAYKIATEDVNKIPNTMKFNYIFSAINVFNYGKKLGKIQSDLIIPELKKITKVDVDSNNEIIINDTSMKIIDFIKEMEATLEPWDWLSNAHKLSEPTVDTETAS